MTIKERKILVFFLKQYFKNVEENKLQELDDFFINFFSRTELIEILEHSYFDKDLEEFKIETLENSDLLELIGDNYFILTYTIDKIEKSITSSPTLTEHEKTKFFTDREMELHYLYSKPTEKWDEYDVSNYYGLLWKHGKTKRVWAIFASDVNDEDKYAVTTKPSFFFDTEDEAIAEIESIIKEKKFNRDELKVMSLWQIT